MEDNTPTREELLAKIAELEAQLASRADHTVPIKISEDIADLPDPTAYDSAFRTMLNRCLGLVPPLLNEFFPGHLDKDAKLTLLHLSDTIRKPGLRDDKRIPDSMIAADDLYPPILSMGDDVSVTDAKTRETRHFHIESINEHIRKIAQKSSD